MNLDFSFIVEYMPYYFEGIKYTLLISLVAVLFGACIWFVIILYEDFKFSHMEDQTFKNNCCSLYRNN